MRDAWTWVRAEWDRVLGLICIVAGALALLLMWNGVRDTPLVADQLSYLASGGLGGLFLLATGVMLRISADLHDEWHKLDAIQEAMGGHQGAEGAAPSTTVSPSGTASESPSPSAATLPSFPRAAMVPNARRAAGAGLILAFVVLVVGVLQVRGTSDVEHAIDGTALAVAALVLASVVICGSLVVVRRELTRRKASLFAPLLAQAVAAPASTEVQSNGTVVVVPGLTRFHLDGCPALDGVGGTRKRRALAERSLEPCGICGAR